MSETVKKVTVRRDDETWVQVLGVSIRAAVLRGMGIPVPDVGQTIEVEVRCRVVPPALKCPWCASKLAKRVYDDGSTYLGCDYDGCHWHSERYRTEAEALASMKGRTNNE